METTNFTQFANQSMVLPTVRDRHFPLIQYYPVLNAKFGRGALSNCSLEHVCSSFQASRPALITFSSAEGRMHADARGVEENCDGIVGNRNRVEAFEVLNGAGRSLDSIPDDLSAAVKEGRIPGKIVQRYFELEKSPVLGWLLHFRGFKERLLADELFLTKVATECGIGIFTKTAAELERRQGNFTRELHFVFADVAMATIADFMLVWLPAPTVSLRPPLAMNAGGLSKFFFACPDNAFQVALAGTSYSLLQRIGTIAKNGGKLFLVGTSASLVGTSVTDFFISPQKALDVSLAVGAEDTPILLTSFAYGVYMAVTSNLRYQILAGVIEQRYLEPLLHEHKLTLSAICFAIRTGNTFLGSLMWVDYARWIGIQKMHE